MYGFTPLGSACCGHTYDKSERAPIQNYVAPVAASTGAKGLDLKGGQQGHEMNCRLACTPLGPMDMYLGLIAIHTLEERRYDTMEVAQAHHIQCYTSSKQSSENFDLMLHIPRSEVNYLCELPRNSLLQLLSDIASSSAYNPCFSPL